MAIIKFAPLRIPVWRPLQTLAVALYFYSFYFGALLGVTVILLLLFSSYYPIALLYLIWAYFWDSGTPTHGGRRSNFLRSLKIWNYFRDYFPIKMVKTSELDPKNNYIFGYHPHGVLCVGAFASFATEATDFSTIFPGITPHLLPLMALFKPPLFRDYVMSSGMCGVSFESCEYILTKKGPGSSVCVVIGGAAESMNAHPNEDYRIILKPRKGFIKLALKTGSHLVPVFAFGENNLFNQVKNPPGSMLRKIQDKVRSYVAIPPLLFYGRGIFQYSFGFLPYRLPVYVVVGSPIPVVKLDDPSDEDIQLLQDTYVNELNKLFEENKYKYEHRQDIKLEIE